MLTNGDFIVVLEAGDTLVDPGGDGDGAGLSGIEEAFVGTDLDVPDTDGDGLEDSVVDVDWLAAAIDGFERKAFASRGAPKAIGSMFDDIEDHVRIPDVDEALALVMNLERHSDGFPDDSDNNGWIIDCDTQADWRALLDLYRRGLKNL